MEAVIPIIVTALCVYGLFKRVNIFESFVDGVKEGMRTVVFIAPTMIALLLAVGMLRASGLLDWIAELIRPAAEDRDNRDLILAACGLSNHEQDVLKFNQENTQGIHITIENYAQGTTAEQALRRLNMELSSGAGPDLIDLETFPVLEIYSRQGLLLELSEYLNQDLSPDESPLPVIEIDGDKSKAAHPGAGKKAAAQQRKPYIL